MRVAYCFVFALLFLFKNCLAQDFSVTTGYQYMYSKAWDKAIQTYNFSRPFIKEKQALLVHGTYIETAYFFNSERRTQSGIKLNHNFTRCRSDNENFDVSINLHQVNLGYSLRYPLRDRFENYTLETDVFIFSTIMARKVNQEIDEVDGEKNRAYGIGGQIAFNVFYRLPEFKARQFFLFGGLGYSPYLWSPKSEVVLNQTQGLIEPENISVLNLKLGLRILVLSSKQKEKVL